LQSLAMLRADFYEGVEGAECDMQPQPLVEEAGNFAIRPPFAAKFADQFTVGLQFGAWRLGMKTGQLDLDGLAEAIRSLLGPDSVPQTASPGRPDPDLLPVSPRVTHVVEATPAP